MLLLNEVETGKQLDAKALQDDLEVKESEKETPMYVGCICCCTQLKLYCLNRHFWNI